MVRFRDARRYFRRIHHQEERSLSEAAEPQLLPPAADVYSLPRLAFRKLVHWASYKFILKSARTRYTRVGDLSLAVPPTVFHPGIFVTSRMFAGYLRRLDLREKSVAEIGTGSGVLALAAAKAGARSVLALDINPTAVAAAAYNAERNGVAAKVSVMLSNLFSAVAAEARFDVIISSPPSFAGEPRDIADRAWHAGPDYRDITALFEQAYGHLAPDGEVFILLSSDSNIGLMEALARRAGFIWTKVHARSIIVETFIIFRLTRAR